MSNLEFYKCRNCGKKNCKLWRVYMSFNIDLLCIDCSVKEQSNPEESTSFSALYASGNVSFSEDGRYKDAMGMLTNVVGWRIPAIPENKSSTTYWSLNGAPFKDYEWWHNLPLRS